MGTGGVKTAGGREQGGDYPLVNTYRKNEQCFEELSHFSFEFELLNEAVTGAKGLRKNKFPVVGELFCFLKVF
jgi:hypothetical protein